MSHSVFKRLVSQGNQKVSLCGNGLRKIQDYLLPRLFEAAADHTSNVANLMTSVSDRVENIMGKREIAG